MSIKYVNLIFKFFLYLTFVFLIYVIFEPWDKHSQYRILLITILTCVFVILIYFNFWYTEKKYYSHLIELLNEQTSDTDLIVCPNCTHIQSFLTDSCQICQNEWIICPVCQRPFENGASVLVSPCCGMGFHPAHFESAIREDGQCPFCNSIDVITESNW